MLSFEGRGYQSEGCPRLTFNNDLFPNLVVGRWVFILSLHNMIYYFECMKHFMILFYCGKIYITEKLAF